MTTLPSSATAQGTTDLVLGTFAKPRADRTVLTLYRAFPWAEARGRLLAKDSYSEYRTEFENEIRREILPMLGVDTVDLAELRIARWGHRHIATHPRFDS